MEPISDKEQLLTVFCEEAQERISEIEDCLLRLENAPDDRDLVNMLFRGFHTIKGSSASIGLNNISRFSHGVEGILELVRQGKLRTDRVLVTTLLDALDMVKEMAGAAASGKPFDSQRSFAVLDRIESLKQRVPSRHYKIIFAPDQNLLRTDPAPSALLSGLSRLGSIVTIKALTEEVPELSELKPELLYLRWDIVLKSDRDTAEIRNALNAAGGRSDVQVITMAPAGGEMPLLGTLLVEGGALTHEDVANALNAQKRIGDILLEQEKVSPRDIDEAIEKQNLRKIELMKNAVTSSIRVNLQKLDTLVNLVGEMTIMHSVFHQALASNGPCGTAMESLPQVFNQLQRIGREIQESVMALRMLPVGNVFQRFTRLVRELSCSRNKCVDLVIAGEETELDKSVLERITDPLVHLIRNAIDHGIEPAAERAAHGKPANGSIHLTSFQMGESVYIEVEDDGRGLDRERIFRQAVGRGMAPETALLSDDQVFDFIFLPGFSTAESVSDISGRGVGMDVVKKNIESLNGEVAIRTRAGKGTAFSIKLPLTLAIIDGLNVLIGGETYIIPMSSVIQTLRPRREDVSAVQEQGEVVRVRGDFVPLVRLHRHFCVAPATADLSRSTLVLVRHDRRDACLLVDEIVGQQQVVLKPLGTALPAVSGVAGGTILGNGRVALVLDVPGLMENAVRQPGAGAC